MIPDAKALSLTQVIDDDVRYSIPDYQRSYIWSDEQANELWTDLMDVYVTNPDDRHGEYVLGAIVTLQKKSDTIEIVDGQQRLVTLTLMFCALRDTLKEFSIEQDEGFRRIIGMFDRSKLKNYIHLHNSTDDRILQDIVLGNPLKTKQSSDSEKAMKKNYKMFLHLSRELWKKFDLTNGDASSALWRIQAIIEDLKAKIYFVYIKIEDEELAYQIFQSLNSKGEELNQADLIKSYLVKQSNRTKYINDRWYNIFKSVKKPDNLIYASVLSRSAAPKDIRKRDLYREAKKICTDQVQIDTYLNNLENDLEIIEHLDNPESLRHNTKRDRNKLVHLFYGLNKINAQYFRRPIITACREWGLDDQKTLMLTDCLLKFFFMYRTIGDRGIDILRHIARTITKKIINDKDLDEIFWVILKDDISERVKDRLIIGDFKKQFPSRLFKLTAPIAHYILASIEFKLQIEGAEMQNHLYNLEVEHIFPQTPEQEHWPNSDELKDSLWRLGNLTLVPRGWNPSFKNYSFKIKKHGKIDGQPGKKSYLTSGIILNKKYLKYDKWTKVEIVAREKLLTDKLVYKLKIWDLSEYSGRAKKPHSV